MDISRVKGFTITDFFAQEREVKSVYLGSQRVWPAITDVQVCYSTVEHYIYASAANYAYVTATVNHVPNVVLTPVLEASEKNFYVDGDRIYAYDRKWNVGDALWGSVTAYYGELLAGTVNVMQQANSLVNYVINGASITLKLSNDYEDAGKYRIPVSDDRVNVYLDSFTRHTTQTYTAGTYDRDDHEFNEVNLYQRVGGTLSSRGSFTPGKMWIDAECGDNMHSLDTRNIEFVAQYSNLGSGSVSAVQDADSYRALGSSKTNITLDINHSSWDLWAGGGSIVVDPDARYDLVTTYAWLSDGERFSDTTKGYVDTEGVRIALTSDSAKRYSVGSDNRTISHGNMATDATTDYGAIIATYEGVSSSKWEFSVTNNKREIAAAYDAPTSYSLNSFAAVAITGGSVSVQGSVGYDHYDAKYKYDSNAESGGNKVSSGTWYNVAAQSVSAKTTTGISISGNTITVGTNARNENYREWEVRGTYSGINSAYISLEQNNDYKTKTETQTRNWYAAWGGINDLLTAGGGYADLGYSVGHEERTHVEWASGEIDNTPYTEKSDSATLSIVSQVASRYSFKDDYTLSHGSMGSWVGKDAVTIRVTNKGNTSIYDDYAFTGPSNAADASSAISAYGDVSASCSVPNDIPASGGSVTVSRSVSQTKTRQYYYTSGTPGRTASENCTVTWNTSDVTASADKIGAFEKVRTAIKTFNYTATGEGSKSKSVSCTAYQQANAVTSYGDITGTLSLSVGDIPASGGTKKTSDVSATKSCAQVIVYTSTAERSGTVTYGAVTGADVSANSLTSEVKARTAIKSNAFYITATGEGSKTKTAYATVYQQANAFVSYTYDIPTGRTLSVGDIPASGGSVSSGTLGGTINQVRRYNYTAGNDQYRDSLTNPSVSSDSYSGKISADKIGAIETNRTKMGTLTYYYTCNGKQGSCSADVYQQANAKTSITYGTPSVTVSCDDIPASGGSRTSGTCTYSQSRVQNFTSTATENLSALTTGGTVTWSGGVSNVASLGTIPKARTQVSTINLAATVKMNGQTSSASCPVYQQANKYEYDADGANSNYWASVSAASSIGSNKDATVEYTASAGHTYSWNKVYTSGAKDPQSEGRSDGVTVSINNTTNFSINNTSGSGILTHTTALDQPVTNPDYNASNGSYAVTCSIPDTHNKLTAKGGTAKVSATGSHTHTYYYYYNAVSHSVTLTAKNNASTSKTSTANVSASNAARTTGPYYSYPSYDATVSLVNSSSRFHLNGMDITHDNMGTNSSDYLEVKAVNPYSTGVTKSASTTVTNNKNYGTTTNVRTISRSGWSGDIVSAGGNYNIAYASYNTTPYTWDSGSTGTDTTNVSSVVSTSVGSLNVSSVSGTGTMILSVPVNTGAARDITLYIANTGNSLTIRQAAGRTLPAILAPESIRKLGTSFNVNYTLDPTPTSGSYDLRMVLWLDGGGQFTKEKTWTHGGLNTAFTFTASELGLIGSGQATVTIDLYIKKPTDTTWETNIGASGTYDISY